jgi:hypothetical protein
LSTDVSEVRAASIIRDELILDLRFSRLQSTTAGFGDKPRRRLKFVQRFVGHCNYLLQGGYLPKSKFLFTTDCQSFRLGVGPHSGDQNQILLTISDHF